MNYFVLISTIISAVKAVEALMPASAGKDKLAAVVSIVEGIVGSVAASLPAVEQLVAVVVAGFNAVGLFKKKA